MDESTGWGWQGHINGVGRRIQNVEDFWVVGKIQWRISTCTAPSSHFIFSKGCKKKNVVWNPASQKEGHWQVVSVHIYEVEWALTPGIQRGEIKRGAMATQEWKHLHGDYLWWQKVGWHPDANQPENGQMSYSLYGKPIAIQTEALHIHHRCR